MFARFFNEKEPDPGPFSNLPADILSYLMLFLDLKKIYQMRCLSNNFQKKIDTLLNENFWKARAKIELNQNQLGEEVDCKKLLLNRASLYPQLKEQTKKIFFPCVFTNFFNNTSLYKKPLCKLEFDLKEVETLILQDNAKALFTKVSRLNATLPVFQEDNFDVEELRKIICLEEKNSREIFIVADLAFIKFLPAIITAKAVNCFELFIHAYLGFCSLGPNNCLIEPFSINEVLNTLIECDNELFTNRFIYLTIKLFDVTFEGFHNVILFAYTHQLFDVLKMSLNEVYEERRSAVLNAFAKYEFYEKMLINLEPGYENKIQLEYALKNAIKIINDIPHLTAEKVITMQQEINASCNKLRECLKEKDSSFTYSSYIRPT